MKKTGGFSAEVRNISQSGVYVTMTLCCPEAAGAAVPGQFLHIQCGEKTLRRPISIGGAEGDELTVIFEVKGKGTAWLRERKAGDVLNVLGPLGHGFPKNPGKVLLVGGGVGVPPMYFAARRIPDCDAVLAFRSADRAMLTEEFKSCCKTVQIMSDDGSIGEKGFAAQGAAELLQTGGYDAVFACGPKIMLKTTYEAAKAAGVPCYVSMEERMGCGVGACLGCSVPVIDQDGARHMKRACADGPVFRGEEVLWDA